MKKCRTPLDRAIDKIRGYCEKVVHCDKCRFRTPGNECPFMQEVAPCDWDMDKQQQEREAAK